MNWYLQVLRNYANFKGRARRKEYWMFYLINVIISFVIGFIDGLVFGISETGIGILSAIYVLFILVPSIAVVVRRLHDIGKSGTNFFLILIPLVGPLIILYFMVLEGENGDNRYGPDPKSLETAEDRF